MKVNLYINIVHWVISCTCFRLNGRDILLSHAFQVKLKLRTFIAQVVVMQTLLTDDSVTPSTFRLETFFKDHLKLAIPLRKTILACKIRHLAIKSFKIFKYLILHFHSLGQWIKVTSQAVEQKFWFTTQELQVKDGPEWFLGNQLLSSKKRCSLHQSSRAFVKAPAAAKPLENFLKQNYIFGKSL